MSQYLEFLWYHHNPTLSGPVEDTSNHDHIICIFQTLIYNYAHSAVSSSVLTLYELQ